MPKRKQWRGGFVRKGVFWLDRNSHRDRCSTGCTTEGAALAWLEQWERRAIVGLPRAGAATDCGEAVSAYLEASAATNSGKHVRSQGGAFARWLLYLAGRGVTTLQGIDRTTASDFIPWRRSGGRVVDPDGTVRHQLVEDRPGRADKGKPRECGEAAVNRDLAAMTALFAWHRDTGRLPEDCDPFRRVHQLREPGGVRPHREVALADFLAARAELAPHWADLVTVLLGTAFRYDSAARLVPDAVNAWTKTARDPYPKGKRAVEVRVSQEVIEAAWEVARRNHDAAQPPADGEPKPPPPYPQDGAQQLGRRLKVACAAAGVPRFTAHDLRVTAATVLHRNGMALRDLQEHLGHKSLRTTERYVRAGASAPEGAI